MMTNRVLLSLFAAMAAVLCWPWPARADVQQTAFGHITSLQTGSLVGHVAGATFVPADGDDTVSVVLDAPFVNSAEARGTGVPLRPPCIPGIGLKCPPVPPAPAAVPCRITNGGYALKPTDSGVKLNESVLLSAYLAGKTVSLFLDGCVFNKPRIIGIRVGN